MRHEILISFSRRSCTVAFACFYFLTAFAQADVPIIQPGAPGEPTRELSPELAIKIANSSYSPADVSFMQSMIPHHQQALEMAELVAARTNTPEIIEIAGRIKGSQADEIDFMQSWLRERAEPLAEPGQHHGSHSGFKMKGMATPEEMAALAASEDTAFDRQFLTLMIRHHDGAIKMVEELLELPGSAYDPALFDFTTDVSNDQEAEIERMNTLLVGLSSDPRAGLAAGLFDAGEAILHLEHVATLPRPPGFFDPDNPADLPAKRLQADPEAAEKQNKDDSADAVEEKKDDKKKKRSPLLSFANTDMAFSGDVMVAGSYHGFNVYRLVDGLPVHQAAVVCPGGQGDVSIVGDLLIMSVEQTRGRQDCGLQGVNTDVSPDRFRGLRIFDISDLKRPLQVGAVQTCRGSHTHSVVSGPGRDGKIIVFNSGTAAVRDEKELPGCVDESPGDNRTALFRIDVIEIPQNDPAKARIVASPAVFADPETGVLAGLWRGGDHGEETQETSRTDECHDITVFPDKKLAAGACSGNGILFDISDPFNPRRIDVVADKGFAYWHSATFNNDGTKVIFTDEWGGGSRPRCRSYDPLTWGADAIYDIVDGRLEFRAYFKMPAPQVEKENCVAHNGSIIPIPGRDIFVQSWYQGGISVIDFTDSANPREIAYFDRGPIDADDLVAGGFWSSYWYEGHIYGTEIVRGIDVLKLLPSEFVSEHEIRAAELADQRGVFNPQQQFRIDWPPHPQVANAYLDQLERNKSISETLARDVRNALEEMAGRSEEAERNASLAGRLRNLADTLIDLEGEGKAAARRQALARLLKEFASESAS